MKELAITVNSETGFAVYKGEEDNVLFTEYSGYKTSKEDRISNIMTKVKKGEYRIHASRVYRPEVLLVPTDLDDEIIKFGGLPYIVGSPTHDKHTLRIGKILGKKYVSLIGIPMLQVDGIHESLKRFGTDLRSIGYYGEGLYQMVAKKAEKDRPIVIISDDTVASIGFVFINGLLCASRYYNSAEHKAGFVDRIISSTALAQDLGDCQVALFTNTNETWQKSLKGFDVLKINRMFSNNKEITSPLFYNSLGMLKKKGGIFDAK